MANHRRKRDKFRFDVGHVFDFVASHDQGALDGFVQVRGGFLRAAIHMRKFLHGPNDGGDAIHSVERLLHRFGDFGAQVVPFDFLENVIEFLHQVGPERSTLGFLRNLFVLADHFEALPKRVLHETGVVTDKLDWRVDFVGDSGSQPTDGFELLRVAQLHFHFPFVRNVGKADHRSGDLAVFEYGFGGVVDGNV